MTETFHISGPSGIIAAELLLPQAFNREDGHYELVILMHGFLCTKESIPLGFLSRFLIREGYVVLRFDFNGYGKSEGRQEDNTVPGMIQDATAVWEYATTLPYIDHIILLGHSQGGVVAGMLAGRLEKAGAPPSSLILLAPGSALKDFALRGRFLTARCNPADPPDTINIYGFKMGRNYILSAQTLPIEEESSWYTGSVCLLHGTWDPIVPISCSERYHLLYQNSEFHRIRGTDHLFLIRRRKIRRLILDFLQGQTFISPESDPLRHHLEAR